MARQEDVKQVVQTYRPMLVCLQETKMQEISNAIVQNAVGHEYADNFCFLPANNTRGGILIAFRDQHIQLSEIQTSEHTITATVSDNICQEQWTLTVVYGPQSNEDKTMFLQHLRQLKNTVKSAWLVLGNFNLIYQESDKNNGRVDRRMMLKFRRALNHMEVKEIPLQGH